MASENRLPRALTPQDIFKTKIKTLPFEGEFADAFGNPATTGVWIMWGGSGSGKTSMALLLAKELTKYGKVAYNSLEQGANLSMQKALKRYGFDKVKRGRFYLLSEDLKILSQRLKGTRSPDFVIIDSLQYTGLNYTAYKEFKELHRNKLIIFVSHAEGKEPRGSTASSIHYDAEVKILVEGYRAICKGRTVSDGPHYTVWEKGAMKYWLAKDREQ